MSGEWRRKFFFLSLLVFFLFFPVASAFLLSIHPEQTLFLVFLFAVSTSREEARHPLFFFLLVLLLSFFVSLSKKTAEAQQERRVERGRFLISSRLKSDSFLLRGFLFFLSEIPRKLPFCQERRERERETSLLTEGECLVFASDETAGFATEKEAVTEDKRQRRSGKKVPGWREWVCVLGKELSLSVRSHLSVQADLL